MSNFSIAALRADEQALAYALVRTLAPELSADCWRAFLNAHAARGGGVLVLRGRAGGLFGLASYRAEEWRPSGPILLIENFITIELSAAAPGRKLLTEALSRIAAENGCEAVRQSVGCLPGHVGPPGAMRNHLMITDFEGQTFNRGPDCSCGSLAALTTAEMYPAL